MGKIILNENDVKKIIGEETGLISQRVNEVEKSSKDKIESVINKMQLDMDDIENKRVQENKKMNETIAMLMEKVRVIEEQKNDDSDKSADNVNVNPSVMDNILDLNTLCKQVDIPLFSPTRAKYFLYENGVYDMRVNEFRDAYTLKKELDENVNIELIRFIHTNGKSITFSKDIIEYLYENKQSVLESVTRYEAKKKQYNLSRRNLAAKQVQNYREEIKSICGTGSGERWVEIYKVFAKTFPSFYDNHKKYASEHHVDGEYDISKVRYVVEIMQQGNVLLKIACELYA